jgi:hypothetical protein
VRRHLAILHPALSAAGEAALGLIPLKTVQVFHDGAATPVLGFSPGTMPGLLTF